MDGHDLAPGIMMSVIAAYQLMQLILCICAPLPHLDLAHFLTLNAYRINIPQQLWKIVEFCLKKADIYHGAYLHGWKITKGCGSKANDEKPGRVPYGLPIMETVWYNYKHCLIAVCKTKA